MFVASRFLRNWFFQLLDRSHGMTRKLKALLACLIFTGLPLAAVSVTVSPKTITMSSQGCPTFTATVTGTTNTAVTWRFTGGPITPNGVIYHPSIVTTPPGIYTVTATSVADPLIKDTATVTVVSPPALIGFEALALVRVYPMDQSVNSIAKGQTARLKANFINGTGVIDNGVGIVTSMVDVNVTPQKTTTYVLTVTNAAGQTESAAATVNVVSNTQIWAASPVTTGATLRTASVPNAVGSTYAWTLTGGTITAGGNTATVTYTAGAVGLATLQCTVTDATGVATGTRTVSVIAAPAISAFTAAKSAIALGQSTTLTGTFSNGKGHINQGVGPVTSGVGVIVSPQITTTYTLSAINAADTRATLAVTVTVVAPPDATIYAESPISTGYRNNSASVFNRVGSTYAWTLTGGTISAGGNTATVTYTAGAVGLATLTCTVTNAAGTATGSRTVSVITAPANSAFTAAPTTLVRGQSTTLTGTFSNGKGYINQGVGFVTSGVPVVVSPQASTGYALSATNAAGSSVFRYVSVTVTATATGITAASPVATGTILGKASVPTAIGNTYAWSITGGTITAGGATATVSYTAGPVGTLALTCIVKNGTVTTTRTGTVAVIAAPAISAFTAAKTAIALGQSTTLTGAFSNGKGFINQGIGPVTSGVGVVVSPQISTTYTLSAINAAGDDATKAVTVTVVAPPDTTISAESPITTGNIHNSASVPNRVGSTYAWTLTGGTILFGGNTATVNYAAGAVGLATLNCTVTNAAGTATGSRTVTVITAPVISAFTATPANIALGQSTTQSATLIGTFSNGKGFIDNGVGPVTSGMPVVVSPQVTTTYTLYATDAAGNSATSALTVVVDFQPVITLTPSATTLPVGYVQQFLAKVEGSGNLLPLAWKVQEIGGGTVTQTGVYSAPNLAGTYHVEVASSKDSTVFNSATVTVPLTVDIVPETVELQPGRTQLFKASVAGMANKAVSWSVQEGAGGGIVSSLGLYTAPAAPGKYHVVATSAGNPLRSAIATVNVSNTPHAVVTIAPYGVELNKGRSCTFTATVSGFANQAVTWSASGGTITPTGVYTAPTAFGAYTVKAVSVADPTAMDIATVVVKAIAGTDRTFTYNLNGSLISDGVRTFEWDGKNRLTAVVKGTHRTEFSYDFMDRRVRAIEKENAVVVGDSRYLWDGIEILEQRDTTGGIVVQRFFPEGFSDATGAYTYTRDHLGSIREVTDNLQSVRARYGYDPFGRTTKLSGDKNAAFLYTGHLWHAPSGLYLAPFRAYDPDLGRWISRDPIGEKGGVNLYVYAAGNPVNLIDPNGAWPISLDPTVYKNWCGKNFSGGLRPSDNGGKDGDEPPDGPVDRTCYKHDKGVGKDPAGKGRRKLDIDLLNDIQSLPDDSLSDEDLAYKRKMLKYYPWPKNITPEERLGVSGNIHQPGTLKPFPYVEKIPPPPIGGTHPVLVGD